MIHRSSNILAKEEIIVNWTRVLGKVRARKKRTQVFQSKKGGEGNLQGKGGLAGKEGKGVQ